MFGGGDDLIKKNEKNRAVDIGWTAGIAILLVVGYHYFTDTDKPSLVIQLGFRHAANFY